MSEAVKGGLVALAGFVAILWQGFRRLGQARKVAASRGDHRLEVFLWGFGASLFANAVAFIGIWYFDQSSLIWYALLAMICTITVTARVPVPVPERAAASGFRPAAPEVEATPFSPDGTEAAGAAPRHIFT